MKILVLILLSLFLLTACDNDYPTSNDPDEFEINIDDNPNDLPDLDPTFEYDALKLDQKKK